MYMYAERCGDRGPVTIPGHDCNEKKIRVSSCRFVRSNRFGTHAARLSVSREDAEKAGILEKSFWPDHIYIRPWSFGEAETLKPDPLRN